MISNLRVSRQPNLPLSGIVVLGFGQVFQGPYATLLMAKAGADVIKIEPPHGEPLRRRAPPGKSTTFPIAMLNSNKRAITLNLKHQRGRALLFEMARRADLLLENFHRGQWIAGRPLDGADSDQPAPSMPPVQAMALADRIATI
jgi:crotonobetainyl-CoA:carnitine CoA-transferase CaiB-like acyl-CoA transferase